MVEGVVLYSFVREKWIIGEKVIFNIIEFNYEHFITICIILDS